MKLRWPRLIVTIRVPRVPLSDVLLTVSAVCFVAMVVFASAGCAAVSFLAGAAWFLESTFEQLGRSE